MSEKHPGGRPPLGRDEPSTYIRLRLPESLKEQFIEWCSQHNVTMSEQIRQWIEETLQEDKTE